MGEGRQEPLFIAGRPIVTIYHDAGKLFSIVKLKVVKTNAPHAEKEMIVTGHFPRLEADESYRFTGSLANHPKYGVQFRCETFRREMPSTETGIIHYLSGDLFPGIGRRTAEQVVQTLGADALRLIAEDRSCLDRVPRLAQVKKDTIAGALAQNYGMETMMIQLNEWGFGPQIAMKIYQRYREQAVEQLRENPYRLIEDIEGIGFQRADELARQIGVEGAHIDRLKAALLHLVQRAAAAEGHVFLEAKELLPRALELLQQSQPVEIGYEALAEALAHLADEGKLVGEGARIYLPTLYYSEVGIASNVEQLLADNAVLEPFPDDAIASAIGDVESKLGVSYAATQAKAIRDAIRSPVMILTGGPGTGKTTVVRGIVDVYAALHDLSLDPDFYAGKEEPFPIRLCAPTGRAAKRLSESTELPATTIHRLLGFTGKEEEGDEAESELSGRLFIVDEMSMVDTWLAHQLLKSIPAGAQVVFVGDEDQLPPVGPGQVLKDLLASGRIPTVELREVHRQAEGSSIIELAHWMKRGEMPPTFTDKTGDRSFIPAGPHQLPGVVEQVVANALAKGHSIRDVQVLAPMYRGPCGIDALNRALQELTNPNGDGSRREIAFGDSVYRVGDKVLQLENQPDSGVYNGDMGEVQAIFYAKETTEKKDLVVVSFDGVEVTYEKPDLKQLKLAYCCSVHKAQGSEFPIVIMPVTAGYAKMLRRNLLYTAITRARDFLILCGDPETFRRGVGREEGETRHTTLAARLQVESGEGAEAPAEENRLTAANADGIDPMIGMAGVRP